MGTRFAFPFRSLYVANKKKEPGAREVHGSMLGVAGGKERGKKGDV